MRLKKKIGGLEKNQTGDLNKEGEKVEREFCQTPGIRGKRARIGWW